MTLIKSAISGQVASEKVKPTIDYIERVGGESLDGTKEILGTGWYWTLNSKSRGPFLSESASLLDVWDRSHNHLDPIFKWTGGKRREIKQFQNHFPPFVFNGDEYTYVEPFAGGAATYWHLNNVNGKNILNDFDSQVINFYKEFVNNNSLFVSQLRAIGKITAHNDLEKVYYKQRNKDKNNGLKKISDIEQAIRFFVVNQLAFSGMRRFNALGEFNVPFGHYKGLNTNIIGSKDHRALLNCTDLNNGDFADVMISNDIENTFMFLDPPYTRVFKKYSANNSFSEIDHNRLAETIKKINKASIMMIIDKSDFTEKLYAGMIKSEYNLKYGVNIKNRFNTAVQHLIVCNY